MNSNDLGIRECLEYFRDKYSREYACNCNVSDRSPSKLTKLSPMSVEMSTPEQIMTAYNSLVDAYNKLIDDYNRLKREEE